MRHFYAFFVVAAVAASATAQSNTEFRATWIVDNEWLEPGYSAAQNQAKTREILDNHVRANMNAVLWQIRRNGTVYFESSYELYGAAAGFDYPGYDPLAYAIQEAHARGLEFHAWFNVFESRLLNSGSPAAQHPEWICRDRDGNIMPSDITWLSPGLSPVRDYLVAVAMELVHKYDIDGLHLDFVRWNEHTNSTNNVTLAKRAGELLPDGVISEEQLRELQTNAAGRYLYDLEHPSGGGVPAGFSNWEDWWRWSVTEFVRTLHDSIQAIKPWVRLSPATLGRYNWGGWNGYNIVYQDAALWFNQGYIDQLTGMHYHWTTGRDFYEVLVGGCPDCWGQYVQPGVAAGRLFTVGPWSNNLSENNLWSRHREILSSSRAVAWVDGFQFFSYSSWESRKYFEAASAELFPSKAKIRATKLIVDRTPGSPAIALTKLDSLNYQITVNPPDTLTSDHWFAVYRSPDANLNVAFDDIVHLHYGHTSYTFTDAFTGTQDYNGAYHYFATMLDRYWNESERSNSQQSDPIPSFAPTVTATTPASGDTIPVNRALAVTFSKSMNTASLANAITFSPTIAIGQLQWSEGDKTVTIKTSVPFEFATSYTLTLSSEARDINGRRLDGNGDGVEGDAFSLTFQTLGQDLIGPLVVVSYPTVDQQESNFAIDEVVTFVFDEIIDKNTVDDNSVRLYQQTATVPAGLLVTNFDDFSVLSMQALDPLEPGAAYSVSLSTAITDTLGNPKASATNLVFSTLPLAYQETLVIEQFLSVSNWQQPSWSGSTTGIIAPNTNFAVSSEAYLPASSIRQRQAPRLTYKWDTDKTEFLIRVVVTGAQPLAVTFDTTYVLQCHVFGDGSGNLFRFAVDDSTMDQAEFHEVSRWMPLDWYGWRLVEWQLNDPASVGIWIGDGVLHGPALRFDSFQLTHVPGAATRGKVSFDNLRLVKKSPVMVGVAEGNSRAPQHFRLHQNFPNPFNPATSIAFELPSSGAVVLAVYDVLGQEVSRLIDKPLTAGRHTIDFNAAALPSGVYLYRLRFGQFVKSRRMLVVK